MIIFSLVGINFEVISTTYGLDGSNELDKIRKNLNLKKSSLRAEGSPHAEVLIVPATKTSMKTMGKEVSAKELMEAIIGKRAVWSARMAERRTPESTQNVFPLNFRGSEDDEPIRHNRRDSDRKNSRKEQIRHARRSSTKRNFPEDSGSNDESDE